LGPEIESLAEIYGLNSYPVAASLPPNGTRQLSVKINNWANSSELTADVGDISYVVEDSDVLEVSPEGLITGLAGGETNITVQYGDAEVTIPVLVEPPETGPSLVDESGGVVEGEDGSLVMLAPGALTEESSVNLTPLQRQDLSLPVPDGFEFVGAFELELGDKPLEQPVQLAIPAPPDLKVGSGVLFLRKGQMPDVAGAWSDTWLIEEIGVAGSDGTIRTTSPPYNGIGTFAPVEEMLAVKVPEGLEEIAAFSGETLEEVREAIEISGELDAYQYLYARANLIGAIATSKANFEATSSLVAYAAHKENATLEITGIPEEIGEPVTTTTDVSINEEGLPSYSVTLEPPMVLAQALLPPVLEGFAGMACSPQNQPVAILRAQNFLNGLEGEVGNSVEDLVAKFYVGNKVYEGKVVLESCRELEDGEEIAVEIPNSVPLGESEIVLVRRQRKRVGPGPNQFETIEVESERLSIQPQSPMELVLTAQPEADTINIVDLLAPEADIENGSSQSLLDSGSISVGSPFYIYDAPGHFAATRNGARAYVPLENSGKVALVDLMASRQLDNNPETEGIDLISLPAGASPVALVIDARDEYAYIADGEGGKVYVLDIDINSDNYHQVVKTIQLNVDNAETELRQMAASEDGMRLFVTASDGKIYVVNIDPDDRPADGEANSRKWWEQIGAIATEQGAMGISATADPLKMTFASGSESSDYRGFGVLEVTNNEPGSFAATTNYAKLGLSFATDYFDVDEGVAVTIMKDGSYAFVAGRDTKGNEGESFFPDEREGGNIGIIKDPLGPNPKLVGATRPIPGRYTNNVLLSNDDRYLVGSYPTKNGDGEVYVFDVEEIIKAIENPEQFFLDGNLLGVDSDGFDEKTKRPATLADLEKTPIDELNSDISIAADYEILGKNFGRWNFGVPPGSTRAPIEIGGDPFGMTSVSVRNFVELESPVENQTIDSLKPKLEWKFKIKGREADTGDDDRDDTEPAIYLSPVEPEDVKEINLYVSVFPEGEGLLPRDHWDGLPPGKDHNPNRVLTARWQNGMWTWNGGSLKAAASSESPLPEEFPLPDELQLTGGQTYHWAVEVVMKDESKPVVKSQFDTPLPIAKTDDAFGSVTVLTAGVEPGVSATAETEGAINAIAEQLEDAGAAVMRYLPGSGQWRSVTYNSRTDNWIASNSEVESGQPLVLLADWIKKPDSDDALSLAFSNAGVAEEAADGLFASLVELDLKNGGTVGGSNGLYDSNGDLIRQHGAVFNAPLHFIGFGQGAVVNAEIIQRLGTYFPEAGGLQGSKKQDIQMTTVDPFEYNPEDATQFNGAFSRMLDPEIVVWKNVTYADNYYQTQGKNVGDNPERVIASQEILGADMDKELGKWGGFDPDNNEDNAHRAAVGWYAGTANLNESQIPAGEQQVFRRLGDLRLNGFGENNDKSWYVPGHTKAKFDHGDTKAPWEGIGTGWFYSANAGGRELRPYFVGSGPDNKKSKDQLGNFEDYLNNNRLPLDSDNTYTNSQTEVGTRMRGDLVVPTLFNGNFDTIAQKVGGQENNPIPGWSVVKGQNNHASQQHLIAWHDITKFAEPNNNYLDRIGYDSSKPNYAFKLSTKDKATKIVHNNFVVPEWGDLRFNLLAPEEAGKLKVFIETRPRPGEIYWQSRKLKEIDLSQTARDELKEYEQNLYKIGFGRTGFETFQIPIDDRYRGKIVRLSFQLESEEDTTVYLDDVFFSSVHLKFGNPSEARFDSREPRKNPNSDNLLIEKPQYALSYSYTNKTPSWVSWQVNKAWLGDVARPDTIFAGDPQLPEGWPRISTDNYTDSNKRNFGFDQGHIIPSRDRTNHEKDNRATFLGTNLMPQSVDNNRWFTSSDNPAEASAWYNIEEFVKHLVTEENKELYVVAGSHGTNWTSQKRSNAHPDEIGRGNTNSGAFQQQGINIPKWTWKTILVLDRPRMSVADVTKNTKAYTFLTPNLPEPYENWPETGRPVPHPFNQIQNKLGLSAPLPDIQNSIEWRDPSTWQITVEQLERLLQGRKINLLLNVPEEIRKHIKKQKYSTT
jgi:DNA/RNA endonuclease G (NUC1)